jgi:hypothetical protein
MKYLKVALPVVALALLVAACAAKLPQSDVDAATAAFADAKAAQAELFAADSWKAASDANDALQANLASKSYGKTKALAKSLLDLSAKAKSDAAIGLEAAKGEVAQLVTEVNALLPAVQKDYALAAKAGSKAKVDVKAIKAALAAAPKTLADAQAQTDIAAARAALAALKDSLSGYQQALESAGYKAK